MYKLDTTRSRQGLNGGGAGRPNLKSAPVNLKLVVNVKLFHREGSEKKVGVGEIPSRHQSARNGCATRDRIASRDAGATRKSKLFGVRGGLGAEVGYDQADFFVGDLGWEGFLEGLEAVHSELAAGGGDLVVAFGGQPDGLKFGFASFDEIGDQGDYSAQGSLANLSNFIKCAPLN